MPEPTSAKVAAWKQLVLDVERLYAENERYRTALERIAEHQKIIGCGMAPYSETYRMAMQALEPTEGASSD